MCKSPLVVTALIALLSSVGAAAAQRGTIYDWNGLSPPEAEFMAQQSIGLNNASHSMSKSTIPSNPTRKTSSVKPSTSPAGDPPGEVSLDSSQKRIIFSGAIALPQPAPPDFQPQMGATVPQSVTLFAFDDRVQSLLPVAKEDDYVKLPSNDVMLVDPSSRKVVAIVEQKDVALSK